MRSLIIVATALIVTAGGSTSAVAAPSSAEDCMPISAATRTEGTIRAASSTRISVEGSSRYWMPEVGWVPLLTDYRITVQRQGSDGTWTSFNAVTPDQPWQITASPGVYRLAYVRDCAAQYASSSTRAVRVTAPKPAPKKKPAAKPRATYYPNCAAARAADAAPLYRGDPGYRAGLDRDGDGIACE